MKAVERHLYIRKGYYCYRAGIAKSLLPVLPVKELVIALSTQDLGLARVHTAQLGYGLAKHISQLRQDLSSLSPEQSPNARATRLSLITIEKYISKVHPAVIKVLP